MMKQPISVSHPFIYYVSIFLCHPVNSDLTIPWISTSFNFPPEYLLTIPKSQGSPTVGNSNAGDGAEGDGSQGTQQGGANSNGQGVNYSGTDNNV